MRIKAGLVCLGLAALPPSHSLAQDGPLSVIDWLSDSLTTPPTASQPVITLPSEADAGPEDDAISVTPLDEVAPVAVGLLPASVTGLPPDLWAGSTPADIATGLNALQPGGLPALQSLLFRLVLAELDPPTGGDPADTLFLARLDTLLRFGAVEDAAALIDRAGRKTPPVFRRAFDAALLTGDETAACAQLVTAPELSPSFPARVFCLARSGDWQAAALTLGTGEAIGVIDADMADLLRRFLDPAAAEAAAPLPKPQQPSPLQLRLYEAVGEALPTREMPLAFAYADLSDQTGWRQQLEAAERLVRSGALAPNRLLGLYTVRAPAASGGVWDHVAAIQALDAAVADGDPAGIAAALPAAWTQARAAELEPAIAALYAARLPLADLDGAAFDIAARLALLSEGYETAAQTEDRIDPVLAALATGQPGDLSGDSDRAAALLDGFRARGIPARYSALVQSDRLGEAILLAMAHFERGAAGDLDELTHATQFFRAVGLHGVARRAVLEVLILERRG